MEDKKIKLKELLEETNKGRTKEISGRKARKVLRAEKVHKEKYNWEFEEEEKEKIKNMIIKGCH